jgi:pimeloyl-ACP methyl ester carboxylesterase
MNSMQAQEISGDWYGNLNVQGTELPLVFHLQKNDSTYSSTMDSPKQGGFDIKVDTTRYDNSILTMTIAALGVKYEGNYDQNAEKIKGTFQQGGMSLPLNLTREKIIEKIIRPQEPTKPFPYNSEEISFYNDIDKITLAGTLTTPKNKKDFTTAILISGSGPQNRNEEIMNHKPFLIISDYLTRNGIAVLRYDDRGIGESQGEYSKATSKDLSRDTEAAIKYLKSRKDINKNKIGLVGHSEGGLIAPMIASNTNDVSFIVLLAGPGLKGGQLLLLQKKLIEQKSGINDTAVNKSQEIFKGAYEIVSTFKGNDEELRNKLKGYFNEKLDNSMEDSQMNSLIENITSPWMKYFIKYDPSSALKKIDIPVLALFGKNDLQVPAVENSKAFQDFGNKNIEIIQLDKLNHLFQESKTGMPNEYSEIEQTISPKVLDIISKWIIELN